jgi:hypothetical protein
MTEIGSRPGLDDPIWEMVVRDELLKYISPARDWWKDIATKKFATTGSYSSEGPHGMFVRFTKSPLKSPLKGIQAFPYVPTAYLQIKGVQGGCMKMVDRVCSDNRMHIEEFTIVVKSNLPATYNQGQILCIIPTKVLEHNDLGRWLYLTRDEQAALKMGNIPQSLVTKIKLCNPE